MLVVVASAQVHLADAAPLVDAVHLRQHADLEAPVARDADAAGHVELHGELAGQRVAECAQVPQVVVLADGGPQRSQQRRHQQAHDAPVEARRWPLAGAVVEAFRERVPERGMQDRVQQPGQQAAVVGEDVGVVQSDALAAARGQEVAEAVPHVAALARLGGRQHSVGQHLVDLAQARPVVPQQPGALRQAGEELLGLGELRLVGSVDAHDDLVEVGDLSDLIDDAAQCRAGELAVESGDDQCDGAAARVVEQLGLVALDGPVAEAVKRRNRLVLLEVGHAASRRSPGARQPTAQRAARYRAPWPRHSPPQGSRSPHLTPSSRPTG